MTRKELLPLLRTQWGGGGLRGWGGLKRAPKGLLARAGPVPVEAGTGEHLPADLPALRPAPAPAPHRRRVSCPDYNSRGAPRTTLLLSHHPIPTPCLQTRCSQRWGSGAWWGGEQGWRLWRQRCLGPSHPPALDPTGHRRHVHRPLESPAPTPPLFPRRLPILRTAPSPSFPGLPTSVLSPLPLLTPGPALLGAPLP